MDKTEAINIAKKYVNFLESKYSIVDVLLFGSYAKGTNHSDSDIDIAIVLQNVKDIFDTQVELLKLRRSIDLRIEPHPFESDDFNNANPMVNEILKHGIRIERPVSL